MSVSTWRARARSRLSGASGRRALHQRTSNGRAGAPSSSTPLSLSSSASSCSLVTAAPSPSTCLSARRRWGCSRSHRTVPSPDEVAREALVARAALGRHRSASWSAPPQVSATWLVRRTPCDGPPDDDATWGEYVADGVGFVARAVPWRLDPRERRPERARPPPASAQTFRATPIVSRAARQEDIPTAR